MKFITLSVITLNNFIIIIFRLTNQLGSLNNKIRLGASKPSIEFKRDKIVTRSGKLITEVKQFFDPNIEIKEENMNETFLSPFSTSHHQLIITNVTSIKNDYHHKTHNNVTGRYSYYP